MKWRSLPQVSHVELQALDATQAADGLDRVYRTGALPVAYLDEGVVNWRSASDVNSVYLNAKVDQKLLNLKGRIRRCT